MRRRQAFTLVELLVTIALVIFIMTLLSEAFIIGVKTFRDLKALGDMDERLRAADSEIIADLQADHFLGKARLGDPNFWQAGPPSAGFFRIYAPSAGFMLPWAGVGVAPSYFEGSDGDTIPSAVVTDTVLHFTVKLRGNKPDRFFTATNIPQGSPLLTQSTSFVEPTGQPYPDSRYQVGAGTAYNSQWAEVAYFLIPNGDLAGSTPLFTLYRTQLVVAPDTTNLNWPAPPGPVPAAQFAAPTPPGNYQEMSCLQRQTQVYFFNPSDLVSPLDPATFAPTRAFDPTVPGLPDPNTGLPRASTFVIGDVISFEVQALVYDPTQQPPVQPNFRYVNFDTGAQPPQTNLTIRALQITIRVWDSKTQLTRQVTIVQDL